MIERSGHNKNGSAAGCEGFADTAFGAIFHSSPDAIIISRVSDRKVVAVNAGCTTITGYEQHEMVGKTSAELGLWADLKERDEYWALQMNNEFVKNFPFTMRDRHGSRKSCMLCAKMMKIDGRDYVMGVARDITEEKKTAEALAAEHAQLLAIFDSIDEVIYVSDPATYEILYVNPATQKRFPHKLIGRTCYREFQGLDAPCPFCTNAIIMKNPGKAHRWEFHNSHLGRDYEIVDRIIKWPDGRDVRFELAIDITERTRARQRLEDANRRLKETLGQLKQSEDQILRHARLSALGQMARGISHELNNVLTPILGYADLLLTREEKLNDKNEVRSMLGMIHSAALDAGKIVTRLHDFFRPKAHDTREPVHLHELVESVVTFTLPRWKNEMGAKGISIEITTEFQDMPAVCCNRTQIREAFLNLVLNAIDAMPGGGAITIRGRALRPEKAVEIEVSDTGAGMSPETRQRLFEPFFTTRGEERSGLGLPITHAIIAAHNGTIRFESSPGRGTAAIVRLPMEEAGAGAAATADIPPPVLSMKTLRVLFVDDNPVVRELITEYLEADNHTFETAESGAEGLRKLEKGHFDLVITDSAMPGMSGSEFAKSIRKSNRDIPVIMLTGFGQIMQSGNNLPAGVSMVLSKPVTRSALRAAILSASRAFAQGST